MRSCISCRAHAAFKTSAKWLYLQTSAEWRPTWPHEDKDYKCGLTLRMSDSWTSGDGCEMWNVRVECHLTISIALLWWLLVTYWTCVGKCLLSNYLFCTEVNNSTPTLPEWTEVFDCFSTLYHISKQICC